MLCKGRIFAAIAAFGAFAACQDVNAHPGSTGLGLQQDDAAITKVDYYYSGDYGDGDGYYHRANPLEIPVKVLGGVASLIGGFFSIFDDEDCYSRPYYVSSYYGSPYYHEASYYREAYDGGSDDDSPYGRDNYYLDARYGGRQSYRAHREYELFNGYDYTYYYNEGYGRYR
jgi:hypothetical protein